MLELLIDNGADTDLRLRQGSHELYEAPVIGAKGAVAFFLAQGVDASMRNIFGWTPLHGAAASWQHECVDLLLKKRAEPSPVSDTYQTPREFVENSGRYYGDILIGDKGRIGWVVLNLVLFSAPHLRSNQMDR